MKLLKTLKKKTKKLDFWDIGCIKWSSILFGAILGAYLVGFVKGNLAVIIVLMLLLMIRPMVKWFKE